MSRYNVIIMAIEVIVSCGNKISNVTLLREIIILGIPSFLRISPRYDTAGKRRKMDITVCRQHNYCKIFLSH